MTSFDPQQLVLDVFHGQLHPGSAHLYARLSGNWDAAAAWEDGWRLFGTIDGPFSEGVSTLPAQLAFEDQGPGSSLLAHVQLPDPCYWTPEVPLRYRVRIDLRRMAETVRSEEELLGLRQLGLDSGKFQLEQQPWTLMGGELDRSSGNQVPAGMASVTRGVDSALLEAMSAGEGWCITLLEQHDHAGQLDQALRDCHAAASLCVVLAGDLPTNAPQAAPNLIRAQLFEEDEEICPAPWAQLIFARFSDPAELALRTQDLEIPVVAVGIQSDEARWDEIKVACQQLLQQLAAFRQFAGYIVMRET